MAETLPIRDALMAFAPRQPLRAALFLTYAFDGRWFEEALVPDLCDRPIATMLVIRDRNAITSEAPSVRYRKVNAARSAVFHPKLVVLIAEDRARAVITSANLTRGGYERQAELGRVFDLDPEHISDRTLFASLVDYLAKGVSTEVRGDAARELGEIVEALREVVSMYKTQSGPHALLHNYERPIWDQVLERLPHRRLRRAVIVSPFFEPDRKRPEDPPLAAEDTSILGRIVFEDFEFEPPKHEPSIQVFFRQSEGRTELPVRKLQKLVDRVAFFAQDERQRRLHAKLVLLEGAEGSKRSPFLVALHGSPNFTSAGLLRIPPYGNSELAILTELPAKRSSFSQSVAALGLTKGFTRVEDLGALKVESGDQPPAPPGQGIADSTYRVAESAVSLTFLQPTPSGARVRVLLLRDGAWIAIGEAAASSVTSVVVPVTGLAEVDDKSKLLELRGMSLRIEIVEASGATTSSDAPVNVDLADEFCGLTLVGPALLTLDERIARAGIGVTPTYREQQQWLEERKASNDVGTRPSRVAHQADLDRFYRNIHQGLRGLVQRCEGARGSEFSARRSLDELLRWSVEAVAEGEAVATRECRLFLIERLLRSMRSVVEGASSALAPRIPTICADLRMDARLREVTTWLDGVEDPAMTAYAAGAKARATHLLKTTKDSP